MSLLNVNIVTVMEEGRREDRERGEECMGVREQRMRDGERGREVRWRQEGEKCGWWEGGDERR